MAVNLLSWQNHLQDKAKLTETIFFETEKEFELLQPNRNIDGNLNANYINKILVVWCFKLSSIMKK